MPSYKLELALKDSVKKFIGVFEKTALNHAGMESLVRAAVRSSKIDHLRYIFLRELAKMYIPGKDAATAESLVGAACLKGHDVLDIPGLSDPLAQCDSIEIFHLLKDFHYPVTSREYLNQYLMFQSLNIISHLLQKEGMAVSNILSRSHPVDKLSFELLVLFNTTQRVTISKRAGYCDFEDSRKHIFESNNFESPSIDGLIHSIRIKDIASVKNIIGQLSLDKEQQYFCLDVAIVENCPEILSFLLQNHFTPKHLRALISSLYFKDAIDQLELTKVIFTYLSSSIIDLIQNDSTFHEQFFCGLKPPSIQYLFNNGILSISLENMYLLVNITKPDSIKQQLIFLYSMGFPINSLETDLIKSPTSRERISGLLSYLQSIPSISHGKEKKHNF